MHVVQCEHHARARCQCLEQRSHRAVRPEALVLKSPPASGVELDVGRDRRELLDLSADQAREAWFAKRSRVVPQSVDYHGKRQFLLHLRGAATQHEMAASVGPRAQLVEQARLADAGLTAERDDR